MYNHIYGIKSDTRSGKYAGEMKSQLNDTTRLRRCTSVNIVVNMQQAVFMFSVLDCNVHRGSCKGTVRLLQGDHHYKEIEMLFAFEKTPHISLSHKLIQVQFQECKYGLFSIG